MYSPKSKEFQEEANRLGLTGYQLMVKYQKEGKFADKYVKKIRICCICESHDTYIDPRGCEIWFKHKCQKEMCTRYLCKNCYDKYDSTSWNNVRKSLANCRTDNLAYNKHVFGDNVLELACILYGWEDLNKKYDSRTTPIDCYDPKTDLYHQVQGRHYNNIEGYWPFTTFEKEWKKKFKSIVCFCISEDGKIVERIYKFPENIAKDKGSATIVKNSSRRSGWYEKYREKNEDELKNANDIWISIIENKRKIE